VTPPPTSPTYAVLSSTATGAWTMSSSCTGSGHAGSPVSRLIALTCESNGSSPSDPSVGVGDGLAVGLAETSSSPNPSV
jgi:hypothetical protein